MGYYVNPINGEDKESWLKNNGEYAGLGKCKDHDFSSDKLPVCLVDNGWMTAAAVIYDKRELEAFSLPEDRRPKYWYLVKKELLKPFLPERFHG